MTVQRHLLLSVAAAAAAAGLVLSSCTTSPAGSRPSGGSPSASNPQHGGSPVVSAATARSVVTPTMAKNNTANARLDTRLLASYEAGSAFALDNSTYSADRVARFHPPASPFAVDVKQVGLTRQTTWPASFVAEGTQHPLTKAAPKGPSCGTVLDFERASAASPWRIVLEPSIDGTSMPSLASDGNGFGPALAVARVRRADAVPRQAVKAFLAEETSGRLGPFTKADFTGQCWQLPNPRLDVLSAESSGFSQRDLFSAAAHPDTSAVALTGGGTLVMFTLRYEDELLATSSAHPIPWTHPSLTKEPGAAWTYFLATGTYSSVNESGEVEMAVELSPSGRKWSVVGSYSGVLSVTGHRVKASTSPPSGSLDSFRR